MAHKNLRLYGSGRPGPTQKAWDIAHENLRIGRNSSFLDVKCKKMRNGHGRVVTMVS